MACRFRLRQSDSQRDEMKMDLVLLRDEVALLKLTSTQSVVSGTGGTLSQDGACDFCCQQGLGERQGEDFRLTPWGDCIARKLIRDGSVGAVWLLESQLDVLRAN